MHASERCVRGGWARAGLRRSASALFRARDGVRWLRLRLRGREEAADRPVAPRRRGGGWLRGWYRPVGSAAPRW